MKNLGEEVFRVATIQRMSAVPEEALLRGMNKAKDLVRKILSPLQLGERLTFSLHEDPTGQGWLLVRIRRSGQVSLFAEFEVAAAPSTDRPAEHESAKALLRRYLEELKEVMLQFRISGYELEELSDRLPEVARLREAFGVRQQEQSRVCIESDAVRVEDFALSPLQKRHIRPQPCSISFEVDKVGKSRADIRLSPQSQVIVGAQNRNIVLHWDRSKARGGIVRFLVNRMEDEVSTDCSVKVVRNARGTVVELLLEELVFAA